jgi:hypothetical protein
MSSPSICRPSMWVTRTLAPRLSLADAGEGSKSETASEIDTADAVNLETARGVLIEPLFFSSRPDVCVINLNSAVRKVVKKLSRIPAICFQAMHGP